MRYNATTISAEENAREISRVIRCELSVSAGMGRGGGGSERFRK